MRERIPESRREKAATLTLFSCRQQSCCLTHILSSRVIFNIGTTTPGMTTSVRPKRNFFVQAAKFLPHAHSLKHKHFRVLLRRWYRSLGRKESASHYWYCLSMTVDSIRDTYKDRTLAVFQLKMPLVQPLSRFYHLHQ
jgi:hypothetical protein